MKTKSLIFVLCFLFSTLANAGNQEPGPQDMDLDDDLDTYISENIEVSVGGKTVRVGLALSESNLNLLRGYRSISNSHQEDQWVRDFVRGLALRALVQIQREEVPEEEEPTLDPSTPMEPSTPPAFQELLVDRVERDSSLTLASSQSIPDANHPQMLIPPLPVEWLPGLIPGDTDPLDWYGGSY